MVNTGSGENASEGIRCEGERERGDRCSYLAAQSGTKNHYAPICISNRMGREATRAICETLKTQVKLNLNFIRPHAITC